MAQIVTITEQTARPNIQEPGDDFHLAHNDTSAKHQGKDLSSDVNLPIWDDIDGEERG